MQLPSSATVDVATLSRLFDDRTNSYKFFFFLALLGRLRRRDESTEASGVDRAVPLAELALDMAMLAWYPSVFCKLSLGATDQLGRQVNRLRWGSVRGSWLVAEGGEWLRLREECRTQLDAKALLAYVPYRLLRPFFSLETAGLRDAEVNATVVRLATQQFAERKPIYRFTEDGLALHLHHDWVSYLESNLDILEGWCKFQLAQYLQQRNPAASGIVEKLVAPSVRASLEVPRDYWRHYLQVSPRPVLSVFTGQPLGASRFCLDHFVPWSYVAHNRTWNLAPELDAVNSAKSDLLPARMYIEGFVRLQYDALTALRPTYRRWNAVWGEFRDDLKLPTSALDDYAEFRKGLGGTLERLCDAAARQGFQPNWTYRAVS